MKNQLIILLEKVLHKQNQLRPIKTDAAMFQFETYNTVLELIRERIADSEYPTVNAPFVQLDAVESIESSSRIINTTDDFIWLETLDKSPIVDNSITAKLERGVKVKAAFKDLLSGSAEILPTGSIHFFTASGSWK